jgi:hypothetical protein
VAASVVQEQRVLRPSPLTSRSISIPIDIRENGAGQNWFEHATFGGGSDLPKAPIAQITIQNI